MKKVTEKDKKETIEKTFGFLGVRFSLEWTSLMMDISLFVFLCTKTFLGQLQILEYIAFAMFIISVVLHVWKLRKVRNPKLKLKMFFFWYGGFALFAILSVFWALDIDFVLKMLPSVIALSIFTIAIVYYTEDKNQLMKIISLYVLANFLASIVILGCFWFVNGTAAERVGKITGVFANTIAQTIAFSVTGAAYFVIKNKKIDLRCFGMIATMVGAVLLSGSRKAILIPVVSVALLLTVKKKTKREFKIYSIIFGFSVVTLVLVLVFNEGLRTEMLDLFSSTLLGRETDDWSIQLRGFFRDTAIDMWKQRPVAGFGLNNFAYFVSNYTEYNRARYSHNNYVELLSCLGIIGLALYYWIYVCIVVKLIRKMLSNRSIDVAFGLSLVIPLLIFEWGVVSYSGVMYNIIIFISYYFATENDFQNIVEKKERVRIKERDKSRNGKLWE